MFGNIFGGEDKDNAREVKEELIKQGLGTEDIDLDKVDDEDLDTLLAKAYTESITCRAKEIYDRLSDQSDDVIAESLSETLGFHLEEAKSIVKDFR